MLKSIVTKEGNKFYQVTKEEIDRIEEELGIIIPKDLKYFYKQVGYGFLESKEYRFNRIMSPNGVINFRFRKGEFENNNELNIYESFEKDKLIFFEMVEGSYLSIGFSKDNKGQIFDGNKKIANDLVEFLIKYQENELYFYPLD